MGAILGGVLSTIIGIALIFVVILFIGRMIFKMILSFFGIGFLLIAMYFGYQWYKDHKAEVDARVKKELSSEENQKIIQKIQKMGEGIKEEVKKQLQK